MSKANDGLQIVAERPAGGAIPTPWVCHIDTADEAASAEANNEDPAGDVPDVPDATDR
ncbi:hypothetical protein [Streptomyces sp. 2A115]|uniref:hypothetical protein n=1 Tax=Streptomyces sp. 2A115 TaxID=3457439 RepID=UPI003FCF79A2